MDKQNIMEGQEAGIRLQDSRKSKVLKKAMDFDSYLFDLDGTIYVGEGVLPGAVSTIQALRERSKTILFATNTTVYTRETARDKLMGMGIGCSLDEIMTALTVAGKYFQDHAPDAQVLLIGGPAMQEEMDRYGIACVTDPMKATHILVGLDKHFDYGKLTAGMTAMRNGALLIAANSDPFCPTDKGVIPDTGSLVKALETASMLPAFEILGKPSKYFADYAFEKLQCSPEQCLMVGDRLDTDILLGNVHGMYTALVLSGSDSREGIVRTGIEPDYLWSSIDALIKDEPLT
ncbi:MAG: HAD-IIA family hydrolase [Candidatus Pristimantibacillus sp.]